MRVMFPTLPTVSVTGRVRDYEPVTISTEGLMTEGFFIEVEGDELSAEVYIEAFNKLLELLQDVVIENVNKTIHKRLNPPSSL